MNSFNHSVITSAFESSGDGVNRFRIVSRIGTASFMNNPLYECALFFRLEPIEGITVVLLKPNIETGSPNYLILSGLVFVSSVILLAKSLDTFLPISAPKPLNIPPSENPIAASADAPMATPPAAPAVTISSLTIFF